MMKRLLIASIVFILFSSVKSDRAHAAFDLKILQVNYNTHYMPGENVNFSAVVKNNEAVNQWAEIDVVLTNRSNA